MALTLWLVHWLAKLPLANISVPSPNLLEVGMLYLLIFSLLLLRRSRLAVAVLALAVAIFVADVFYWWRERWQPKELRVTHLNVGHGDAAVVELPGGKVLLIDAGGTASGEFDTGEGIVAPFLRSRKILKVDYLFLSHPRIDHYGGMQSVVREFSPSEFWSGPGKGKTLRFDELEETLAQAAFARLSLNDRSPCRDLEGVRLCVLYPSPDGTEDSSVVIRLDWGKVRFLFAGDIDKRDESALGSKASDLQSTVLKVPRHGSAMASTAEFVAMVKPSFAVFSASGGSSARQPRDDVMERYKEIGAEILHTATDGAIIFTSDGQNLRYETYKSGRRGVVNF
jgi:competence protein ComEC